MKKKILIVEDDVELQDIYRTILEDDYKLTIVKTVKSAKDYLSKEIPKLILLDIILPKTLGDTFLSWLKKETKYKDIPVICITVLGDLSMQLQKIDPEVICIPKPFERKKLMEQIKKMI